MSSLLPNNKPIWRQHVRTKSKQSKFPATNTRSMAHALKTFWCRGTLGTKVNPDTIGCVWTGKLNLNTLRVDGEIFESGKKKLRIQKYPDTCGFGFAVEFAGCVWTVAVFGKKKLQIQKYPDACGQGLIYFK